MIHLLSNPFRTNLTHINLGLLAMKKRRRSDFSQKHSDSVPKCYVSVDLSVLGLLLTSEKYHGMSGVGKRSILLYMVAEREFEDIKYDHLLAFHQLSVIMGRTALHDTIVFNDKGLLPTREKYHGISGVGKRYE
ncbi:unnamed protein product, partial [Vitis vinifera]